MSTPDPSARAGGPGPASAPESGAGLSPEDASAPRVELHPPDVGPVEMLLLPSALEPVEVDLRRVFLVGIAVWVVVLVGAVALTLAGVLEGRAVPIAAAGIGLGLLALLWERRRRRREVETAPSNAPRA